MKKTLTAAALSSVLVLGLASSALAIHETQDAETPTVAAGTTKVTIDGSVRERGVYDKSIATKDTPGASYYDSRVQLGVKAQVSPEATGYVKLETGHDNSDLNYWGSLEGQKNASFGGGNLMNGGGKLGDMTILEAWVNYQPGAVGIKAGHMPLALGNKVFFDHTGSGDDAIVVYGNIGEATHVAALTIKFDEANIGGTAGTANNTDDIDGYVALVTSKINDNLNLGANWTFLKSSDGGDAAVPGLSMSNIGVTADGAFGPLSYMVDGEFQFGTFMDDGVTPSSDANGWAMKVGGNYDLGVGKVGLLFGYGSGEDNTDNDQDQFINFLTDTTYDTIIAEYRSAIPGAGWGTAMQGGGKNSGLSNLTLYQLNGSTKTVDPLTGKDLSLFASVSYMQLSEDTMFYADGVTPRATGEDKVGTEVDLIATWALTAGLNYKVEAAYLFVGDVFDSGAAAPGNDPDNLMFLRHSLDLKF